MYREIFKEYSEIDELSDHIFFSNDFRNFQSI